MMMALVVVVALAACFLLGCLKAASDADDRTEFEADHGRGA